MPVLPDRTRCGRLVVAGLGHVGLAVARDAVAAGYRTVGLGERSEHVVELIGRLAADDAAAATLSDGLAGGQCVFTDDPGSCAGLDVAVVVPDGRPVPPGHTGALERATVALAPHLRPGALVVVGGDARPGEQGELLAATVELLTGLRAGEHFDLGFAIAPAVLPVGGGSAPVTIVSGIDARAADRTADLYRTLGRQVAAVTPVAAAELVALLQRALERRL